MTPPIPPAPAPLPPPPPAPSTTTPTNLAGSANGFALSLSWLNPVGEDTPSNVVLDVSGPVNASIPLGVVQSFSYPTVPAGTYQFAVRTLSARGPSTPSNVMTLSFPGNGSAGPPGSGGGASGGCASAPQAPTNLAYSRTAGLVTLTWTAPPSGAASYVVNVTGSYVGAFSTPVPMISGTVGPGTYVVNVQAVSTCGVSPASAPVTIAIQ